MNLIKHIVPLATIIFFLSSASMRANSIETKIVLYNPEEVQPYVTYLKNNAKPPVKYVMQLFENYDLVILAERLHAETTQWDLIWELTSDPRFIESVGNIFTEYGSVTQQPVLEQLMIARDLEEKEVERRIIGIQRNFTVWPAGSANRNIFEYLKKLYLLNQPLPTDKKIKLYFSDIPWNWEGMTKADYDSFRKTVEPVRDRIMADRISLKFRELLKSGTRRKKALVVMNTSHAFKVGQKTGAYLFKEFPGRVANVMFNYVGRNNSRSSSQREFLVQDGKWDVAFWMLGNAPLAFDFKGSPFGKDQFDYLLPHYGHYKYADVFTGMIFYQSLDEHMGDFIPGYFNDDGFRQIALERAKILNDEAYCKRLAWIIENPNIMKKHKVYGYRLEFKVKK